MDRTELIKRYAIILGQSIERIEHAIEIIEFDYPKSSDINGLPDLIKHRHRKLDINGLPKIPILR